MFVTPPPSFLVGGGGKTSNSILFVRQFIGLSMQIIFELITSVCWWKFKKKKKKPGTVYEIIAH